MFIFSISFSYLFGFIEVLLPLFVIFLSLRRNYYQSLRVMLVDLYFLPLLSAFTLVESEQS